VSAMTAAGVSSLFLQSPLAAGVVEKLRALDPLLPAGALEAAHPRGFAWLIVTTTAFTTAAWLAVTFLTPPEPVERLREFYRRVRPAALGWKPIAQLEGSASSQSLLWSGADWLAGCGLVYGALFGIGKLLFGNVLWGATLLALAAACALFIFWDLERRDWEALRD
ncbi:MAG: sodium:solute symporter family protein, partial [Terriglobales bacterium]